MMVRPHYTVPCSCLGKAPSVHHIVLSNIEHCHLCATSPQLRPNKRLKHDYTATQYGGRRYVHSGESFCSMHAYAYAVVYQEVSLIAQFHTVGDEMRMG